MEKQFLENLKWLIKEVKQIENLEGVGPALRQAREDVERHMQQFATQENRD